MRARSRARAPAPPTLGSLRDAPEEARVLPPAEEKTTNLLVDPPVVRSKGKLEEAPETPLDAPPAAASAVAVVAVDPIGRASSSPEGAPSAHPSRAMPSTYVDDALASFAHAEMLKTLDHSAGDSSAASGLTSAVFDGFPGAGFGDALGGAADAFAEPTRVFSQQKNATGIDRPHVGSETLAAAQTHQTHQTRARLGEDAAAERRERLERLETPARLRKDFLRKEFFPNRTPEPNAFGRDWFDFEYAPPPETYAAYEDTSVGDRFFPPPRASSAYDAELAAELYGDAVRGDAAGGASDAPFSDARWHTTNASRGGQGDFRDFRDAFLAPPTRAPTTNAPPSPRRRAPSAKRRRAGTAQDLGESLAKKPRGAPGGSRGAGARVGGARSTSKFRGVTHHCRTGRWEAHIWEDGKQVYLGGFDSEHQAALAYDVAAVKCRGDDAVTNFCMEDYAQELRGLANVGKEELVLSLRRQSKGFSKGSSKYRGVTRHQKGRWEARIGQLVGKKYRYLGLFDTEEDAAVAYDAEAVRQKGFDAVTNFDLAEYADELAAHTTSAKGSGRPSGCRMSEDGEHTAQQNGSPSLAIAPARAADVAARARRGETMRPGPAAELEPSAAATTAVRAFFEETASHLDAAGGCDVRRADRLRESDPGGGVAARKSKHALLLTGASDKPSDKRDALDVVGGVSSEPVEPVEPVSEELFGKRRAVAPEEDAQQIDAAARDEVSARAGGTVQALRAMVEEAKAELASARREMDALISEKKEQKSSE